VQTICLLLQCLSSHCNASLAPNLSGAPFTASKYCCILCAIYLPAIAMSWLPLQHIPHPQLCAAHYLGVHSATQPSPVAMNAMQLSLPSPVAMPLSTLSLQSPFVLCCIATQPSSLSLQGLSPSILPLQCNSVLSSLSLQSPLVLCCITMQCSSLCPLLLQHKSVLFHCKALSPSIQPSPIATSLQCKPALSRCIALIFHCNATRFSSTVMLPHPPWQRCWR